MPSITKALQNYRDRLTGDILTLYGSSETSSGINIVRSPQALYSKKVLSDRPPPIVQILYCTGNTAATHQWPALPPCICAIFGAVQEQTLCKLCARGNNATQDLNCWSALTAPSLVQILSNSFQILCKRQCHCALLLLLLHQHLCKYFQALFKFCAGHASQQETWALKLLICFCWSFTTLFSSVSVFSASRLSL